MSKAKDLLEGYGQVDEASKRFKSAKVVNGMAKLEKADRKFWKEQDKKYPETKNAPGDPQPGEPAYPEFKAHFEKSHQAKRDLLKDQLSVVQKEVAEILSGEDVVATLDLVNQLDDKLRPLMLRYSFLETDEKSADLRKKYHEEFGKLSSYRFDVKDNFVKSFQDRFEGKTLKGKVLSIRADRFHSQNGLLNVVVEDSKTGQEFPIFVEKGVDFEEGDNVKFSVTFQEGGTSGNDWNALVSSQINAGVLVFLRGISK